VVKSAALGMHKVSFNPTVEIVMSMGKELPYNSALPPDVLPPSTRALLLPLSQSRPAQQVVPDLDSRH